jgi:hypothetical protein
MEFSRLISLLRITLGEGTFAGLSYCSESVMQKHPSTAWNTFVVLPSFYLNCSKNTKWTFRGLDDSDGSTVRLFRRFDGSDDSEGFA